jgi:hypothetical protein
MPFPRMTLRHWMIGAAAPLTWSLMPGAQGHFGLSTRSACAIKTGTNAKAGFSDDADCTAHRSKSALLRSNGTTWIREHCTASGIDQAWRSVAHPAS